EEGVGRGGWSGTCLVRGRAPVAMFSCWPTDAGAPAHIDAGHYANAACVDDGPGGATQACASEDVPASQSPHLSITKVATEQNYKIGRASCRDRGETTDGPDATKNKEKVAGAMDEDCEY